MSDTPENNWLPIDLTGRASTHYIVDEVHSIYRTSSQTMMQTTIGTGDDAQTVTTGAVTTVDSGKTIVIAPYRGCFYNTDLVVKHVSASTGVVTVLSAADDYRLVGMDVGRTRVSSAKGGVYRFIMITCDTSSIKDNDTFHITYHAFGGELDSITYEELLQGNGGGSSGGSSSGGADSATVTNLQKRVNILTKRLNYSPAVPCDFTLSNANLNWRVIAESTDDLDSYTTRDDLTTLRGIAEIAFFSHSLNAIFDLAYTVRRSTSWFYCDLKCNTAYQQIDTLDVRNEIRDNIYFNNNGMLIPLFRIGTRQSTTPTRHRFVIEMAIASNSEDEYPCYIGDQTDLILIPARQYTDPNTNEVVVTEAREIIPWNIMYDTPTPTAFFYSNIALGVQDYYKIWEGNLSLAMIEDVSWTKTTIGQVYNTQNKLMPKKANGLTIWPYVKNLPASAIGSLRFEIFDRFTNTLISVDTRATRNQPFASGTATSSFGRVNYFEYDNCLLEIFYTEGSRPTIKLYSASGANSYINKRFDLRAIYVK